MIFLESFREEGYGIDFSSDEEAEIVIKAIDGYTGLTMYQDSMRVAPGSIYFYSHRAKANLRTYEIWNFDQTQLLLKASTKLNSQFSLSEVDRFGALKNFKYNNPSDKDPGLPLCEIFLDGLYEKIFQVEPGDVVVDIGANLGLFSYYALCKGALKVYCFEPSSLQCATIRENFQFHNLVVEEAAVTDKEGTISFFINPSSSINSSILFTEESVEVKCKSVNLEKYLDEAGEEKIDYLKMDCEGGEYSIFESLSVDFLQNRVKKMCVEYHHNHGRKILPILGKLYAAGFRVEFEHNPVQIDDTLGIFYAWKQ